MTVKANLMKAVDHLENAFRISRRLQRVSRRVTEIENERQALRVESRGLEEQLRALDALNREYWSKALEVSGISRDQLQVLALDLGEAEEAPYPLYTDVEATVDAFIKEHAPFGEE